MTVLRTGDRAFIRELNTSIVLDCIRRNGPIARSQIAEMTGMGRSTISGIVAFLVKKELVEPMGAGTSTGGRKPEILSFKPDRYAVIGMKLQPDGLQACLADLNGELSTSTHASIGGRDLQSVMAAFDAAYAELTRGIAPERLLGVGLAIPGLVDAGRGVSVHPHFFEWRDVPIREHLESRWNVPVWLDNDARVGALGERWELVDEADTFLFVTIGVGIGAGIVLDGTLMEGGLVGGGHLGHTKVEIGGRPCHCGLRGCLETVASDEALLRYVKAAHPGAPPGLTPADVFALARSGDAAAADAVDRVAAHLAIAIGNVIKLLGIRRVVVGGETGVAGGDYLYRRLQAKVREQVFAETQSGVEVVPSRRGNSVWLVGAASLVLEAHFRPPIYADSNTVLDRVSQGQ